MLDKKKVKIILFKVFILGTKTWKVKYAIY